MSWTEFEYRVCVHCEAKYIEDCRVADIEIGTGKPLIPKGCWRREYVKEEPKPHDKK
jgi:hypothetical protein